LNQAAVLTKNTIYMVLSELAKPLVSYFLIVYISRVMGKEGIGLYSTILAFFLIFETLAGLGMGNVITRDVAVDRSRASTYISSALVVGLVTSLVSVLMISFLSRMLHFEDQVRSGISVISISLVFFVSACMIQSFLEGLQRMEHISLANTLETFLRVLFGVLAIRWGYGIAGVLWATVIVRTLIFLYCFITIRLLVSRPFAWPDLKLMGRLVRQSMTFLLIAAMVASYSSVDVLMLSRMWGSDEVGIYSAASRLMYILKGLSYGYIIALFPQMASDYATSLTALSSRCFRSIKYLLILTLPVCVGTAILSGKIIGMIYGQNFAESALCLQIIIWTILFFPLALVFARALVASHNQFYDLVSNTAAMVSNIGLNLAFIWMWGFLGAAIATVLTVFIFLIFESAFVHVHLFRLNLFAECKKPLIAVLIMGGWTYALRDHNFFAVIITSAMVYSLSILLLRTFSAEEIKTFQQVWRNKYRLLTSQGVE
jgi:O-antigen/teichoic acid export membrane protein